MSASSKKKLRNEQNAAKLTGRQLAEQKEAKKLKIMTVSFTAVLALILVVAIAFASVQFVNNSGIREKSTVAVTLGDAKLSNAQLNYYFVDAAFEFANTYGAYASMFGLNLNAPLNEQVINEETGGTWADDFTNSAISNAKSVYALCAEAEANGYTLSEEELAEIDNGISQLSLSAIMSGFASADEMVKAYYGKGASMEGYAEYARMKQLAQSYYAHYAQSLTYDEAALRGAEAGNEIEYNNYSYAYYYVNVNKYLEGGTTDEEGNTTYSDAERAAAVAAAEAAAQELSAGEYASIEDFNAAIAAMSINAEAETAPTATVCTDYAYANVTAAAKDWITNSARTAGEMGCVANTSTSTAEDDTETETVNGYYVLMFQNAADNNYPLANVRHILITPEGGTYNSTTGNTDYTEEELLAAKVKAEKMLKQWKDGEATEDTFAQLAADNSTDPGSVDNGGLYEDVYPGQMVETFNDWCFAEGRQYGDTGIVETTYGYHIMFYAGDSDTLYRDYLIKSNLMAADTEAWYTALLEALTVTEGDTKYLSKNLVLSAN